ncbi:MAG: hypothetical protein ABUL77_03490 [Bacteroidota bacterium]
MVPERFQRPPPRERTFAELFPWRNIRRAVMLVLLIVAIVVIKRSTGGMLTRVGEMWGTPRSAERDSGSARGPSGTPSDQRPGDGAGNAAVRQIRLGPGLAPRPGIVAPHE